MITFQTFRLCAKRCRRFYSNKNILNLRDRGIIQDIFPDTSTKEITNLLKSKQCVYAGFDPTAESLHVGNLLVLVNLLHWQRAGHNVIALIGGATGRIGDPSGRTSERPQLQTQTVNENIQGIQNNIHQIFENHSKYFWDNEKHPLSPLKILNNEKWYRSMDAIEFVSQIGRHFRMGTMLLKQSVQKRINSDGGMSFTEFTYQIFQAYDWLYLNNNEQCNFQIGGSDQMGNIMAGYELISRISNKPVYGMTLPLVTTEEGDKFGKSAGNAIWLDSNKTSPFSLYQFFVRTKDLEIEKFLKFFTFMSLREIHELMESHNKIPEQRKAQKKLAEVLTVLVHGDEGLKRALKASEALYSRDVESLLKMSKEDIKEVFVGASNVSILLESEMTVLNLAMRANCFNSENDAMRIIKAGGFHINHQRVTNFSELVSLSAHILPNMLSLLRVGKRNYYIVQWLNK